MSTFTRRRRSPSQNTHSSIYTQAQHGVEPDRRADQYNQLFPSKPVAHRRSINPKTQDSHHHLDFEKITINKKPKDTLSQGHYSNGKETSESRHPQRKDKLLRGELEMTRAIHEKQLMLQEKLWRLDAKVRQKVQRDSNNAVEGSDRGRAERGKTQTETRHLEQKRGEPARSRRQEDVKQQMKRQDQRLEEKMKNIHEEKKVMWREERRGGETDLQRKGFQGTQKNKSRWEDVKDHTRGKGGYKERDGRCREREERPTGITKERDQCSILQGNKGWSRERKHGEMYESDSDREITPMSHHKTSPQNCRGAGRNHSQEPHYPPGSSPSRSSRQEQDANQSLQLLPCRVCGRNFASQRLEKHVLICEKVIRSTRPVFNTFANRIKGTSLGEYLKTHSRATTPETIKKKKQRHKKHE